ncbi:tetratricopeptide repeat protein [Nocardia sp. NPDC058640]|uniref:tetratricopeptide repeat protein n=1 Tax=Nocardia sp. NPDC058640 TaxID=3346571 RepID=UPI00366326B1
MTSVEFDRAMVLEKLGRHEAAREKFAQVVAAEPDNVVAVAMLAVTLMQTGEYSRATEVARDAIRLRPDFAVPWEVVAIVEGVSAERAGDDPRAVQHEEAAIVAARRCLELDPTRVGAYRALALAVRHRDKPGAIAAIETALELEPDNADLHRLRGQILWDGQEPDFCEAGRQAINRALQLDPDDAEALFLLGYDAAHRGELARADLWLRRAAEIDPGFGSRVRDLLAWIAAARSGNDQPADAFDSASSSPADGGSPARAPAPAAGTDPVRHPGRPARRSQEPVQSKVRAAFRMVGVVGAVIVLAMLFLAKLVNSPLFAPPSQPRHSETFVPGDLRAPITVAPTGAPRWTSPGG